MNIEETKKAIEVMQAYVDGKKIEEVSLHTGENTGLVHDDDPDWNWEECIYRIKPEPKIIYVNEAGDEDRIVSKEYISSIPYIRLSDVELLK